MIFLFQLGDSNLEEDHNTKPGKHLDFLHINKYKNNALSRFKDMLFLFRCA